MTNDDNLAVVLRNEAIDANVQAARLRSKAERYRDDTNPMVRVFLDHAKELEAQAIRANELAEALAGGKLKIVDEYTAVKALEQEVQRDHDREPGNAAEAEHYSPLRVAQLALTAMKEKGAIR